MKKYNEWSASPESPDIRMEYNSSKNEDLLNQDTDEVCTKISNTITRLRQKSSSEDITLKETLSVYLVREYADVPENLWNNIQNRNLLKIRPSDNGEIKYLYQAPDFKKRVASMTEESYSKYKELIENPIEEIFLLDTILRNKDVKPKTRFAFIITV